jgi:hypothetical protein
MRLRLGGSLEDYKLKIKRGEAQIHVFKGGFAITEIKDYNHPQERVLNVLLLGGKRFDEWKSEADLKLVSFARVNGCQAIEFACRLGLAKKVADLGYTEKRKLMRKELECGTQENLESFAVAA